MDRKKLVILDGNSLMNRAFYALPPMSNSKGQPTGAIYGFTTMLFKIFNEIKPDYIASTFDLKAPTFRHNEYADYKAGRKKMPDELAQQFKPVKELLSAFNIGIFEIEGYEADDIIGTISKRFESKELEVIIFTGDRDALQLVSEDTKVMITKKGITELDIYDKEAIKNKYGFVPERIIDLKGLMGDTSDNIPGVPGVGEKTALKLLNEYGTLEGVYENVDKVSGKKLKENLENYKEDAFLSKRLATIDRDVPIEVDINSIKLEDYDARKIREYFIEFEFKSLLDKIKIDKEVSEQDEIKIPELKDYDGNQEVIKNIFNRGQFNFVFVFEGKELNGMIVSDGYFVKKEYMEMFDSVFESVEVKKNTFGAKQVYNYLKNIELKNLDFDIEIAAYILNPSESSYEYINIIHRYAGITPPAINDDEKMKLISLLVDNMDEIKKNMLDEISKYNMMELFNEIEMPLVKVLSGMERAGFSVDTEVLKDIGRELDDEIKELTEGIYNLANEEFNINSPKQLGVILFEKLNLPVIKKTKTGYSTDAEVLEELSDKHEVVEKILNYRQLVKLKSTYIDGLIAAIHPDGKIHSSFNQTVTATGRISSTDPNMQNIPVKMEQGRRIRKAFKPSNEEYIILSADYSQIELRVLADISNDASLIDAFKNNQDIHKRTASEVFDIPMGEVTSLYRSRAKAINFGIVYGLSEFGLSRDLKIPRKEAKRYIENYFDRYSGVKKYLDSAVADGKEKGYVATMMNRIRYIPEINSSNRNVKMFGERLAMNTPIQGTAADIIKIAMVNVYNRLEKECLKSSLILQVHDELILEVHRDELPYVKNLVIEEMENAVRLQVPLLVDVNWGNSWYEAK